MIQRTLLFGVLACALLAVAACTSSPAGGDSGSVAMIPFTSEEYGIRGVTPVEGWTDQAVLLQESFPGAMDELVAAIVDQTDLVQLPRPTGTYKGPNLEWDLYMFETQIKDVEPGIYRVDLALAKGDALYYLVILVTRPADYVVNRARYETVFKYALYALTPLD